MRVSGWRSNRSGKTHQDWGWFQVRNLKLATGSPVRRPSRLAGSSCYFPRLKMVEYLESSRLPISRRSSLQRMRYSVKEVQRRWQGGELVVVLVLLVVDIGWNCFESDFESRSDSVSLYKLNSEAIFNYELSYVAVIRIGQASFRTAISSLAATERYTLPRWWHHASVWKSLVGVPCYAIVLLESSSMPLEDHQSWLRLPQMGWRHQTFLIDMLRYVPLTSTNTTNERIFIAQADWMFATRGVVKWRGH